MLTPALDQREPEGLRGSKYHDWWLGWSAYDRPMAPDKNKKRAVREQDISL